MMPTVRPNPKLVKDDVSLMDAIRDLTRGSGPLTLDSVTPGEVGTGCGLPGR